MKKNLVEQIARVKRELVSAKPRSRRRVELELHLRNLMLQQLRRESRGERRRAA
jgi:hypothetical protein